MSNYINSLGNSVVIKKDLIVLISKVTILIITIEYKKIDI